MSSMKLWRHQRDVEVTQNGTRITDQLTFEPSHAQKLVGGFMKHMFLHRHEVIRRNLITGSKWMKENAEID